MSDEIAGDLGKIVQDCRDLELLELQKRQDLERQKLQERHDLELLELQELQVVALLDLDAQDCVTPNPFLHSTNALKPVENLIREAAGFRTNVAEATFPPNVQSVLASVGGVVEKFKRDITALAALLYNQAYVSESAALDAKQQAESAALDAKQQAESAALDAVLGVE